MEAAIVVEDIIILSSQTKVIPITKYNTVVTSE